MKSKAWLLVMTGIVIGGCTWVKLTPGGEKVRVLSPAEVTSCNLIGDTNVALLARIGAVNRNEEKVQKELNALARNSAADMGGDTVVPASEVNDGKQRYSVYKCVGATQPAQ